MRKAILLIGPTGSGKSPLGDELEKRTGWVHFDFGATLRSLAGGDKTLGLAKDEISYIKELLRTNSLFPDDRFPLVKKVIEGFLRENNDADGLILNGLPRHKGQAEMLSEIIDVTKVVVLDCSPKVARERVSKRVRGDSADHSGRDDDTLEAIERKLAIYNLETRPLIEFYQNRGSNIVSIDIGPFTSPDDITGKVLI